MFQIVFNEISAAEMSALSVPLQLELLEEFQVDPEELRENGAGGKFGIIERDGRTFYRYRANDYRIYFELTEEGICVHRVLHKNTIRDFLFRAGLPMAEEEQDAAGFWELIDEGARARRKP